MIAMVDKSRIESARYRNYITEMGEYMMHKKNSRTFLLNFMKGINFPDEAKELYDNIYQRILMDSHYAEQMNFLIDLYSKGKHIEACDGVDKLAEEMGVHSYTLSMLLLLLCAEPLLPLYHEKQISEEIYWDSMKDLTYKLQECHKVYGIWGTFVREWYPGFYQVARFAFDCLQYEFSEFLLEHYELRGNSVNKGDKVLNMHIPSSGKFTQEKRLASYKRAYQFFEKEFGGRPIPMVCHSWLLYPGYREILPENSNIRSFMNDFTYIEGKTEDKFDDAWRVFGKDFEKEPKDWPRESSLQRSIAEYVEQGNKAGSGYGIFFFDGENIIQE